MAKKDSGKNDKSKDQSDSMNYVGDEIDQPELISVVPKKPLKPIHWKADDFATHDKSTTWYVALVGITLAVTFLVYLATKDKITSAVLFTAGIIFGAYAAHKPNAIYYTLDGNGLTVGKRLYGFNNFRSFSVIDEGKFTTVLFIPFKRFMPAITVHCRRDEEKKIVDFISGELPTDNHGNDLVDRFLRRINY